MNTDEKLIIKIMDVNELFSQNYEFLDKLEYDVYKCIKGSNDIIFRHMRKTMDREVSNITNGKGIVGVDGSINTVGSSFPHYISVMKGLAKCTNTIFEDVVLVDIHTPLLSDEKETFIDENVSPLERDEKIKAAKMARLELECAYMALQKMDISLIMMDGSLIRYKINCEQLWDDFVALALQKGVYVIGVIEEIKTKDLYELIDKIPGEVQNIYDREILFGKLEVGQMITIRKVKNGRGLKKCFMRTSIDPHVIGMDVLEEQQDKINELADLVYTLTSETGRGIPLWLDIVDSEVKISNSYVKALIESHIDEGIRRRFFSAKRDFRVL